MGLLISEGIIISAQAVSSLFTLGLYTEVQVTGWQLVTQAVHEAGGLFFA
jgi:N-ethylmaleimide reductase